MRKHLAFFAALLAATFLAFLGDKSPKIGRESGLDFVDFSNFSPGAAVSPAPSPAANPAAPSQNAQSPALPRDKITYFDVPNTQNSAHSSALVNLAHIAPKSGESSGKTSGESLMLAFFAGSREGARDVGIWQSFFDAHTAAWSAPTKLLSPEQLSLLSGKFVKKLGNPVIFADSLGRVHLFVVGTSLGGWATSRIYWLIFEANLRDLRFIKELTLSPFLNTSFLVRSPAILGTRGDFLLPIYFELGHKYPLFLHFDAEGRIAAKIAPTRQPNLLQPSLAPLDSHRVLTVYRNKGGERPMQASVCDFLGGFCATLPSNLFNFGASSILFSLHGGQTPQNGRISPQDSIFLAHNQPAAKGGNAREELWIYGLNPANLAGLANPAGLAGAPGALEKPLNAEKIVEFERGFVLDRLLGDEVSYPAAAVLGDFAAISYTYGRRHIRVAFVPREFLDSPPDSRPAAPEIPAPAKNSAPSVAPQKIPAHGGGAKISNANPAHAKIASAASGASGAATAEIPAAKAPAAFAKDSAAQIQNSDQK